MTPATDNLSSATAIAPETVVVGVEIGPAIIRAGVFGKNFHLLGKTKITTRIERGPAAVIERIAKCIRYAVDECDLQMSQVVQIGIAVPGKVHGGTVVESSPELLWEDINLQTAIAGQFEVPVSIGQLYERAALGVLTLEIDRPVQRFAAIFVGPQIGAGVCLDGEWQDLTPLQAEAADVENLQRHVMATLPHPVFGEFRGRDFRKALKKTDSVAIRDYAHRLADLAGECAARIHRQFSTEVIALGGGLLDEMKDEILARAQASLRRNSDSSAQPLPTLIASRLGDLAPITGAAIWTASQPSALTGPLVATA